MKRIIVLIAMCILAAGFLPQAARADLILYPSDDTWVDSDNPASNMDGTGLQVGYWNEGSCTHTRRTYLRFDLSALPVDIGSATFLSLYPDMLPSQFGHLALWSTGDDWNGGDAGPGDETTLVNTNAPGPTGLNPLATELVGPTSTVVEFLSTALHDYINQERNGDEIASFVIQWDSCPPQIVDTIEFEDREESLGTGEPPHIYPFNPTAISLRSFTARVGTAAGLPGLLIAASAAVVLLAGLYMAAEGVRRRLSRKSK